MFQAEFWVAVAFLILMGVFGYFGVHRTILRALDHPALVQRCGFGCQHELRGAG